LSTRRGIRRKKRQRKREREKRKHKKLEEGNRKKRKGAN